MMLMFMHLSVLEMNNGRVVVICRLILTLMKFNNTPENMFPFSPIASFQVSSTFKSLGIAD